MKILFTGDRNWTDTDIVFLTMIDLLNHYQVDSFEVIHGWAKGLDTIVDETAQSLGFPVHRNPSHWRHNEPKWVEVHGNCAPDCHEVVGRPAGMIRNKVMFDHWKPELVIGFHDKIDESRGTKGMLEYALKQKCPSFLVTTATYTMLPGWLDKLARNDVSLFFNFD